MISLRKTFGAVTLVAAVAATGCGGRDPGDPNNGDQPGCTGVCSSDAGTDAGTGGDAGTQPDAGNPDAGDAGQTEPTVMSVEEARKAKYGTWVTLEGVVVTAVYHVNSYSQDPNQKYAQFWVASATNPSHGIFVDKFRTDLPVDFVPRVGQRLDITGWIQSASKFNQFTAWRTQLANQYAFGRAPGPLRISLLAEDATLPEDRPAPEGFGDAEGGFARPNPELVGSRVHVEGPLVLTNPTPAAFQRLSADAGDSTYYGFEVTGGILVSNRNTFGASPTDGGPARCDWQALVRGDGGTVSFPEGIRGVWDTYSFAPCADGGTDVLGCFRNEGRVPGTEQADGGFNRFTHVLIPQNCEQDLVGEWDAGTPVIE